MKLQKYKIGDIVNFYWIPLKKAGGSLEEVKGNGMVDGVEIINNKEQYLVEYNSNVYCISDYTNDYYSGGIFEAIVEKNPIRIDVCNYCQNKIHNACIGKENCELKSNDYNPKQIYIGDSVLYNKKRYTVYGIYLYNKVGLIDEAFKYYGVAEISSKNSAISVEDRKVYYLLREEKYNLNKFNLERHFYTYVSQKEIIVLDSGKRKEEVPRTNSVLKHLCDYCIFKDCTSCKFKNEITKI